MEKRNCIVLSRYQGEDSEYLILDPNKNKDQLIGKKLEPLCMRGLGLGADEMLFGPVIRDGRKEVRMFSLQKGEMEVSSEGIRTFAKYLMDEKYVTGNRMVIATRNGDMEVEALGGAGRVDELSVAENFFS